MKCISSIGIFFLFVATVCASPISLNSNNQDRTSQADLAANCPRGYSQLANSNSTFCYMVYPDSKARGDAAKQCKADNGTLASVPNGFINQYLYLLASQVNAQSVWLGVEVFGGTPKMYINAMAHTLGIVTSNLASQIYQEVVSICQPLDEIASNGQVLRLL